MILLIDYNIAMMEICMREGKGAMTEVAVRGTPVSDVRWESLDRLDNVFFYTTRLLVKPIGKWERRFFGPRFKVVPGAVEWSA